jgi:hypothetical protein
MAPRATAVQKAKQKRARSESPDRNERATTLPRTVPQRAAFGQGALRAIEADPTDGEAWRTVEQVITAAHVFFSMFIEDERVVEGWVAAL